jgi:hypothetical protein
MRKLAVAAEVAFGRFGASDTWVNPLFVRARERPTQRARLTQSARLTQNHVRGSSCVSRK